MTTASSPDLDDLLDRAFDAVDADRLDEAEALCRQVLAIAPGTFDAILLLGVLTGESGRTALAIQFLRDAIAIDPSSVDAHLHLGGLLRAEGRLAEAISALETAVRLEPDNMVAHNDLGVVFIEAGRAADAAAHLRRAIALDPAEATAHYQMGAVQELQGRNDEAIAFYGQAAALDPGMAEAHERIANLFYVRDAISEAIASLRRAVAADAESASGQRCQARLFFEEGRLEEAEACLARAIPLNPKNSELRRLLGNVQKQRGRFDAAIACFEQAIAADASHVASYNDLVNAKKLTEADRPLVSQMESLLAANSANDRKRMSLHFALGKALDDLRAYADAIRHYDEANRLKNLSVSFDHDQLVRSVDQSIALFTPDFIARSQASGSASRQPILIVGMPRSGTTLVEQIVSSHPDVTAGDELTFWPTAVANLGRVMPQGLDPDLTRRLADEYLALLARIAPAAPRVTDKMPYNHRWVGLIHSVFPNARIIHIRRHPIDTSLSMYFANFDRGNEFTYDRGNLVFYYRQYLRLMAHWRSVVPPDRLLEIDYEDLIADREPMTRRLIDFCGLDWNEGCLKPERNDRTVKTASMWQARQPIYGSSVERWRNYEPWLGELRQLMPEAAAEAVNERPAPPPDPSRIRAEP